MFLPWVLEEKVSANEYILEMEKREKASTLNSLEMCWVRV